MDEPHGIVAFLFTDIEGSSSLWERMPECMALALSRHDALARDAVARHRGTVVKMSGDGLHAVFDDPVDGVEAATALQQALADPGATNGIALRVRCGLHAGVAERRESDFFGPAVNRAARIMGVAHGGQILLSHAAAELVADRLRSAMALRDLGTVRLRDLASPERVFQLLHAELADDFPPLRSLDATPNNLPQQLTSFIGRERDIAELRRLLRTSRMLTLTGAGGIGKSRLSLQVAAEALAAYPDGVWLVELAATFDPARVQNAVAAVLGVRETAGLPLPQALAAHLASRTLLLILDNCEHLVESCARTADALLRAAPGLAVLATSREPLRIHGEQTYPLPALSLPPLRGLSGAQSAGGSEAVRLFVERARQQQPAFTLTDRNAPVVAAICARLDGIPLALELAAARVRAMSVDDINARLADRFALLTGGDRTVLARQQTLRALVDWSYDLLDAGERILFNRLAVFAAGFDLEAVERVCAAPPLADAATLDLLTALVDKSLVMAESDGQAPRYALLETLREYGRGRAIGSAETARDIAAARVRHAAHYLALARTAHRELVGAEQAKWCDRLAAEHDNLRAAFAWALTEGASTATAQELGAALYRFWHLRGHLTEGRGLLRDALALSGEDTAGDARAGALYAAGVLAFYQGDLAEAESMLSTCLALRRRAGSRGDIAAALSSLANVLQNEGDTATAREYQQQALVLFRELGNRAAEGICLINLGSICHQRSEYEAACGYLEQAAAVGRSTGHGPLGRHVGIESRRPVSGAGQSCCGAGTLPEIARDRAPHRRSRARGHQHRGTRPRRFRHRLAGERRADAGRSPARLAGARFEGADPRCPRHARRCTAALRGVCGRGPPARCRRRGAQRVCLARRGRRAPAAGSRNRACACGDGRGRISTKPGREARHCRSTRPSRSRIRPPRQFRRPLSPRATVFTRPGRVATAASTACATACRHGLAIRP